MDCPVDCQFLIFLIYQVEHTFQTSIHDEIRTAGVKTQIIYDYVLSGKTDNTFALCK
jgi:hypothetical protein